MFGEKLRDQVEERLTFFESGDLPRKNIDVMQEAISQVEAEKMELSLETSLNAGERLEWIYFFLDLTGLFFCSGGGEKKKKKKRRRKETENGEAEEPAAAAAEAEEDPTPKKKKKKRKSLQEPAED